LDNCDAARARLLIHREAIQHLAVLGAEACGKSQPLALACTDTTGLSPTDQSVRTALAYVDVSTTPGKTCSTCQQFIPNSAPNACGTKQGMP
jgi:hypothetical protein